MTRTECAILYAWLRQCEMRAPMSVPPGSVVACLIDEMEEASR